MTPFQALILEALRELSAGGRPVRQARIVAKLGRPEGRVVAELGVLKDKGLVRRARVYHRSRYPGAVEYTLAPEKTGMPAVIKCEDGYAVGYGWDKYPVDDLWRS